MIHSPESLIDELGITEPEDIDLEAIAYYCKAVVQYRQLDGCAARIVGNRNQAIISVDDRSTRGRQRFSIGHELGHWMRDRGKGAHLCQVADMRRTWISRSDPESLANAFAAELLMPADIFRNKAGERPVTLTTVRELAQQFQTSQTATAIRLTQLSPLPALLACYSKMGRRWFIRSRALPVDLFPVKELHHDTSAFENLFRGDTTSSRLRSVNARLWLSHPRAYQTTVNEESVLIGDDAILVCMSWNKTTDLIPLA